MTEPASEPAQGGLLAAAIARPVSVVSAVILVMFFGVLSLSRLPIQLTPDIQKPTVTVDTRWPGASPVEVETEILDEQEEVLKRVSGLDYMESSAQLGRAQVTLEFPVGTSLEETLVRVSNQLSQVPDYPAGADEPVVTTANATGPSLAVILVRHNQGKTVAPYRTWVLEDIVPKIERVRGVSNVRVRGGRDTEVHVTFDPEALAARGLTVPAVANRIREELRSVSAGELDVGKSTLLVRTRVAATTVQELGELVLKVGPDNAPVRLKDVAEVAMGLRKAGDLAIGDDREAIALLPRREAGTNVLEVTEELRRVIEELNRNYFAPENLTIEIVDDQTGYIYEALERVRLNLVIGAALATLVLLLFLRSFAASAIVAAAIPICVLGTALFMTALGRSVNVVSLAGITFAVGMVVDNSIVALENIDTWRKRVNDAKVAALRAIREVWGAILASTATTAAVFIPIVMWEGEVGELLRDIAYAIAISVMLSLVVSVLVIPSVAAHALKTRTASKQPAVLAPLLGLYSGAARLRSGIVGTVSRLASSPGKSLLVVLGTVSLAVAIATVLLPKMEYLPTGNRNLVFGLVLPPPGLSVEELTRVGFENQRVMREHTGREVGGVPAVRRSFFVGDSSRLFVGGVAQDPERAKDLRDYMEKLHRRIPGSMGFAAQAALFSRGIGEGRSVQLDISGSDLSQLIGVGRTMMRELGQAVPGARIRPVPVLDDGAPELHIIPDRVQAEASGFTPRDVALIADAYVDGAILGEFGEEGSRKVDVVLRSRDTPQPGVPKGQGISDEASLLAEPVATENGELLPFGVLADVQTELGPVVIQRIERARSVTLQLTPPDEMPFESAVEDVQRAVEKAHATALVPPSVKLSLGGSAGKLVVAQRQFGGILLIALVISYFLLAGLFEDFLAPVVVMVTIPLAAAGGVLALVAARALGAFVPLDLLSALGFLILIGVVVNNAILIIHRALSGLREGEPLSEAVAEAVDSRVRPIFMSSLTSLAGLLPAVLTGGSGSELYRGIGTIVLGGLALSTLLALFVVPSLFVLLWRARARVGAAVAATPTEAATN